MNSLLDMPTFFSFSDIKRITSKIKFLPRDDQS
jgi:hypothetical protein